MTATVFHRMHFRVLAAVAVIICLSLLSSGGALITLVQFKTTFADIAGPRLVGLIAASKLMKASESIVAHAPNFAVASTQTMRETVVDQLEDRITLLDESLRRVRNAGADASQIEQLEQDADNFTGVLGGLNRLVQERIALDDARHRLLNKLLEMMRRLDVRDASDSAVSEADQLMLRHEMSISWLAAVNRAVAIMLTAAGINDDFQLARLKEEFMSVWQRVEQSLPAASTPAMLAIRDQIRQIGIGPNGIFEIRTAQLRDEASIAGTLAVSRSVASRLVASASHAFLDFEHRIQQQNNAFGTSILYYLVFFVGLALAGTCLGAFIFVYIERGVIRRLKTLQDFMKARIESQPLPLKISGNDEIAEMARATEFFVAEIGRREELLNQMFEAAPIPMTLVRLHDGQITRANGRALSQFDLKSGTRWNAADIYRGELERTSLLRELERNGFVDGHEAKLVKASSEPFWGLIAAQLIETDGHRYALVGATDISLLKEAAEAQRIAKERAEEAVSAKSRFFTTISHELRTPLNAIIGVTEMLCDNAPHFGTERAVEPLGRVLNAGCHLLHLINDILDLSKIDAGKMVLVAEDLSVASLIHEVVETVRLFADANGTRIMVRSSPDLTSLRADRMRLKQILLNLLGNAAKFTANGRITLTVERCVAEGRHWITFQIRDTGIGISKEHLERLFEEFSQADAATSRRYGGTGLGLVISERMCRLMNGKLTATSEIDVGSSFTVWLPLEGAASAGVM